MPKMTGFDGREWELVRQFHRQWEAQMLVGLLESHGVDTWIIGEADEGSAYLLTSAMGLMVPSEHTVTARELIATGGIPSDDPDEVIERRLVDLLSDMIAIPSVTGEEDAIAEWLWDRYTKRDELVRRVGNSIVVGEEDFERPNILLVGHTDVVPPGMDEDFTPERTSTHIIGRGASDMKSGLAVAMDAFEDPALRAGPYNVMLICYAGEEGPHDGNELAEVLAEFEELSDADLAIVLEPTDLAVQLGCLGGLHATLTFSGKPAHSARPWLGENAITKAGSVLAALHEREPSDVDVDGLTYREVFTVTLADTPSATRNIVPDLFQVNLNYRYAPDRRLTAAEEQIWGLVEGVADVEITDRAPPAKPSMDDRFVEAFIQTADADVEPKQAWTDVARFAEVGVAALNYGPGVTAQAHQDGEHVPIANVVSARAALGRFLSGVGETPQTR